MDLFPFMILINSFIHYNNKQLLLIIRLLYITLPHHSYNNNLKWVARRRTISKTRAPSDKKTPQPPPKPPKRRPKPPTLKSKLKSTKSFKLLTAWISPVTDS